MELNSKVDAIFPTRSPNTLAYDFAGYATYTIIDTMEDMVELKSTEKSRWFYFDDESLMAGGTALPKYANRINFFK